MPRSFLFVPGDDPKKLAKAESCGADALILDLEDSVAPGSKPTARLHCLDFLRARPGARRAGEIWVRINPIPGDFGVADLEAIVEGRPDGIVVPKVECPEDLTELGRQLSILEDERGIEAGAIRLMPIIETPAGALTLPRYIGIGLDRLAGLAWGAEDMATGLGASGNRTATGALRPPLQVVRSSTLLAARAVGVWAIETPYVDFRDTDGLRAACLEARGDGFTGRLAIHPAQVAVINECFSPSPAEIAEATRIVAAFAAAPEAGVLSIDGKMVDRPHWERARQVLERASASAPHY